MGRERDGSMGVYVTEMFKKEFDGCMIKTVVITVE